MVECFRAYFERCGDGTPDADSMTCGCEGQKPPHFCPDPEDTSQKSWSDYFILPVLKAWDDALYKRVCPNNDKKKVMAILVVDHETASGYTSLMMAAESGHEWCSLELLKAGALLPAVDVPSTATLIARFGTIGAQASATPPKAFYEIELITLGSCPQIGWASSDFVLGEGAPQDEGVGDDAASWGADGARKLLLHSGSSSSWGIGWCAGDVIGVAADLSAGTIWFGKNGVWEVGFSNVHLEGLFPAVSGSGLICCIRFGDKCLLPPPDEKFVPYPQAPIELLRGEVGTLLNACELPPAVLVRGADIWLLAKGSGNDSCAKLIAEWAAQ